MVKSGAVDTRLNEGWVGCHSNEVITLIHLTLGLHSNGLPCQRTEPSNHYEPITKSVSNMLLGLYSGMSPVYYNPHTLS